METIENQLKQVILSKYKSIREFTKAIDLPYSTVDNIFKRGVNSVNITTIIKICKMLGISADGLGQGKIVYYSDMVKEATNSVIAISCGGDKVQYDLTEAELQAVLTLLDSIKKSKL